MWQTQIESLSAGSTLRIRLTDQKGLLSCAVVIQLWQNSVAFCTFFNALLAEMPFAAFFWETPPMTDVTIHQPFECVVIESQSLATMTADASAFQSHFQTARENSWVITFANLGRDATLIVPYPVASPSVYPHLATFTRQASAHQQQALWHCVGETVSQQMAVQPLWLSSSGLGVSWLHIRLDSRPKYYCFEPYRNFSVKSL